MEKKKSNLQKYIDSNKKKEEENFIEIDQMEEIVIPSHFAIKVIYRSTATTTFGIIVILFNFDGLRMNSKHIALSHEKSFVESIDVHSNYKTLVKLADEKAIDNLIPLNFITDISERIDISFDNYTIEVLNHYGDAKYTEKIDAIVNALERDVKKSFGNDDTSLISIGLQRIDADMEASMVAMKKEEQAEMEYVDVDTNFIKVQSTFVLSPVNGKHIQEITEDDVIMVRVENQTKNGKEVNEMFHPASTTKNPPPIPATVVKKVINPDKSIVLVLQIAADIYSVIKESELVKIELFRDIEEDKKRAARRTRLLNLLLLVSGILVFFSAILYIYLFILT